MAPRTRNYRAEYARRNAIAQSQGFRSYGHRRYTAEQRAIREAMQWRSFQQALHGRKPSSRLANLFLRGFAKRGGANEADRRARERFLTEAKVANSRQRARRLQEVYQREWEAGTARREAQRRFMDRPAPGGAYEGTDLPGAAPIYEGGDEGGWDEGVNEAPEEPFEDWFEDWYSDFEEDFDWEYDIDDFDWEAWREEYGEAA